jgi:hypothetical protein
MDQSEALQAVIRRCSGALKLALSGYDPAQPENARACMRIALVGVIQLLADLYPDDQKFLLPLRELLYGLNDLDHGKVLPFLRPTKVPNSPGNSLSYELFKAIPAAAMTCLMKKGKSRAEAAREVARSLSQMGFTDPSGKPISAAQITGWRVKMMTELARENLAAARYQSALNWVSAMEPQVAAQFLLGSLPDLSPSKNPKKPPA